MGIYDRDYYRRPTPSAVATVGVWSVTTWLIVINVAVFVLDPILYRAGIVYNQTVAPGVVIRDAPPLSSLGHFSVSLAIYKFEIWRFITFQFLHAGIVHLVFNMIFLFVFGQFIESYLGRQRFLAFYLLCGIGGPIAYVILWKSHQLIAVPWVPLVGASAGIFGILIAAARIAPDATVLLYGILPIQLKSLAWVMLVVAAYTVIRYGGSGQNNAGGEAAHLGGAAIGWLLIHNPHWLQFPNFSVLRRRPPF